MALAIGIKVKPNPIPTVTVLTVISYSRNDDIQNTQSRIAAAQL